MPQRITEDHQEFRDIISGKKREELKNRISHGTIFRQRGKNGKIAVPVPYIDTPHFIYGKPTEGVGRGEGEKGDVIDKDEDGKKGGPGDSPGDGLLIEVDLEEVLQMIQDYLELPDMKPKPNQTYEDIRTVYNGKSKLGPRSLLNKKWTMKECMKRLSAMGMLNKRVLLPGLTTPVPILTPANEDRRFRQYNEIKIPSSTAVIFFMRDGSGSMDNQKCDIVSDICWWIEQYIRRFYEKTEVVHIWHDTLAKVVSEQNFYKLRYGGGTNCTSAVALMSKLIKTKYPPIKWNIYGVYFGDGESTKEDNKSFCSHLKKSLAPSIVNMFGVVEILHYEGWGDSLKKHIDGERSSKKLPHVRTSSVDRPNNAGWFYQMDDAHRSAETMRVIKEIFGKEQVNEKSQISIEDIS